MQSERPRQRTFTSCTECRRRKQRCNQAKDRPCNNCARRYPPVACTYDSASPPPTIDHILEFHSPSEEASRSQRQSGTSPGPSYIQTSSPSVSYTQTPTTSSNSYYGSASSYGYYSTPTTGAGAGGSTSDYSAYSASTASPSYTSYSTGGYAPVSSSTAYYQGASGSSVSTGYATSGAYYGQQDAWLSTSDPEAYVDANGEYYYPDDHGYGPTSGP